MFEILFTIVFKDTSMVLMLLDVLMKVLSIVLNIHRRLSFIEVDI